MVSVPIVPPTGFYRVAQGFGPQSLRGTWILTQKGVTNIAFAYFAADGSGLLTNFGIFNLHTPPGHYTVGNSGSVNLTVEGNQTNTVTGQFLDANDFLPTGPSTNAFMRAVLVQNTSLCTGSWTGNLSETNDPNGLSSYSVSLTVAADGSASFSSPSLGTSGSGSMFALAPTNGALSCFIKTGLPSNNPYNQIQISSTLTGNSISGSFTTDSGSGANAVNGTVTLTR